ncbi:TolC family protein [Verrucomicrobiota bacterium]
MRGNSFFCMMDVQRWINSFCSPYIFGILMLVLFGGCVGIPGQAEKQARQNAAEIAAKFQPQALPALSTNANLSDFLQYAMLNSPRVRAAYFEWLSSVERITQARSLPNPLLTFQSDISSVVRTLMPGLMQEFPGPGKLGLRAQAASAGSQAKYFAFEDAVLQTAFAFKRAYYRLYFLDGRIRINRRNLSLLTDLEKIARAQNESGKVTLQDVLRAQIEEDRLATDIANLEDSFNPLLAQLKAALGLTAEQPDPPVPAHFESTPLDLTSDQLLTTAFVRNPRLKAMEAEVLRAEAVLGLAYKTRVPDFGLGLMADVKAAPVMFRPLFGMTLPVWRDKIAAEIAGAQADKSAAKARLTEEQIMLTVDFAVKTFAFREISRNLKLLQEKLIHKARQSLEIARSGYSAGQIDFFNLIDAERTLLNFELAEVEARAQREIILAELSLIILGTPPENAPLLAPSSTTMPNRRSQSSHETKN